MGNNESLPSDVTEEPIIDSHTLLTFNSLLKNRLVSDWSQLDLSLMLKLSMRWIRPDIAQQIINRHPGAWAVSPRLCCKYDYSGQVYDLLHSSECISAQATDTDIQYAIPCKNLQMVKRLMVVTEDSVNVRKCLSSAIKSEDSEIIDYFLDATSDCDLTEHLLTCVRADKSTITLQLINRLTEQNLRKDDNYEIVESLARKGWIDCLQVLLGKRISIGLDRTPVRVGDRYTRTYYFQDPQIVQLLLQYDLIEMSGMGGMLVGLAIQRSGSVTLLELALQRDAACASSDKVWLLGFVSNSDNVTLLDCLLSKVLLSREDLLIEFRSILERKKMSIVDYFISLGIVDWQYLLAWSLTNRHREYYDLARTSTTILSVTLQAAISLLEQESVPELDFCDLTDINKEQLVIWFIIWNRLDLIEFLMKVTPVTDKILATGAKMGSVAVLEYLLSQSADTRKTVKRLYERKVEISCQNLVHLLNNHEIDVDSSVMDSLFFDQLEKGDLAVCEMLLSKPFNYNIQYHFCRMLVCKDTDSSILVWLIEWLPVTSLKSTIKQTVKSIIRRDCVTSMAALIARCRSCRVRVPKIDDLAIDNDILNDCKPEMLRLFLEHALVDLAKVLEIIVFKNDCNTLVNLLQLHPDCDVASVVDKIVTAGTSEMLECLLSEIQVSQTDKNQVLWSRWLRFAMSAKRVNIVRMLVRWLIRTEMSLSDQDRLILLQFGLKMVAIDLVQIGVCSSF